MGFFDQKTEFIKRGDRVELFKENLKDKSCLHVGCADWPIFNLNDNLHALLCKEFPHIEGYDTNEDTVRNMLTYEIFKDKVIHTTLPDKLYDIILMPEVIEHVINPGLVLEELIKCLSPNGYFIITAPDAFSSHCRNQYNINNFHYEKVHPDHGYWFSIFTLPNLVKKIFNTRVVITEVGTLDSSGSVYVIFKKNT